MLHLGWYGLLGSCPLYGPTLQKVKILQKWSCNPLTYLSNCSFNTLQKWQNRRLRYTREYKLLSRATARNVYQSKKGSYVV